MPIRMIPIATIPDTTPSADALSFAEADAAFLPARAQERIPQTTVRADEIRSSPEDANLEVANICIPLDDVYMPPVGVIAPPKEIRTPHKNSFIPPEDVFCVAPSAGRTAAETRAETATKTPAEQARERLTSMLEMHSSVIRSLACRDTCWDTSLETPSWPCCADSTISESSPKEPKEPPPYTPPPYTPPPTPPPYTPSTHPAFKEPSFKEPSLEKTAPCIEDDSVWIVKGSASGRESPSDCMTGSETAFARGKTSQAWNLLSDDDNGSNEAKSHPDVLWQRSARCTAGDEPYRAPPVARCNSDTSLAAANIAGAAY